MSREKITESNFESPHGCGELLADEAANMAANVLRLPDVFDAYVNALIFGKFLASKMCRRRLAAARQMQLAELRGAAILVAGAPRAREREALAERRARAGKRCCTKCVVLKPRRAKVGACISVAVF